jgi:hypothetical protein
LLAAVLISIMNFIQIKNQDGRTVILNVSQITSIWQSGEKTIVAMQHPDDVVTVNEPIDVFTKYLADDKNVRLDVVGS